MSYLEPAQRVVTLLREVFSDGQIKAVYDGDPDVIPASKLPAICVVQINDVNENSDNHSDQVSCELQIRVVFNKRDDWRITQQEDNLTDAKIRALVEARDDTGLYLPTSIKGIIRSQLTSRMEPSSFLRRDMRFELGSVVRPTDGQDGLLTREGVLTFTVVYMVDISTMS